MGTSWCAGLYDKRRMHELARAHGIPTAETQFPQSRDELGALAEQSRFPVLLKGGRRDPARASQRAEDGHRSHAP